MKNENFIPIICPAIGRLFLIEQANPEIYDLETHTNTVEFDAQMLGLTALGYVKGRFLVEPSDPQFRSFVWLGIALVKSENEELGEYFSDPFDGTQNETLLLIGMDLCEKILIKLNQPDWDNLGFDSDNTLWEYMDEIEGAIDYFQRCKRAIYDRLKAQRYFDPVDMCYAMTTLELLEFGPWICEKKTSRPVQILVENRPSLN